MEICSNLQLTSKGHIRSLNLGGTQIAFRSDEFAGFQPYAVICGKKYLIPMQQEKEQTFIGRFSALELTLDYQLTDELVVHFSARNTSNVSFKPTTLGLCSGIDCFMVRYPDWNHLFFPTLLRCERTHFWGYNERPDGAILAFASEDPVASWSLNYNEIGDTDSSFYCLTGGHRIYTWNLHLLNQTPKPERHPLMDELPPHTLLSATLHFRIVKSLNQIPAMVSEISGAPALTLERYTAEPEQTLCGTAVNATEIAVSAPSGRQTRIQADFDGSFRIPDTSEKGTYRITAKSLTGKEAEALFYIRQNNSWYMQFGRDAILENRPLHTHHVEAFNSLYTIELCRKYLPDPDKDAELEKDFLRITGLLYDNQKQMAAENPWRIQDSAALSSLFALRYTITGDPEDLKKAMHLADFLLSCQGADGAYYSIRSEKERTHYTAVTYIAKYISDTAEIEEMAGREYPEFALAAQRHKQSADNAVEELVRNRDNIDTEGELTFEDGMISCSLLQIAYMALRMEDSAKKKQYIDTAEYMYSIHECLTQKLIPDCRMNGGTLRFWEAQYNIHIFHNMMNSPCGWTCWKIYGTWYLYLLTGKKSYLLDTINALGACMQLIDEKTGKLRWGFICDPYVETWRYIETAPGSYRGHLIYDTVCEQYVDLVSPWHRTEIFPRKKWAIDNLVHEIFKCLAEVGLKNACIYEEENGEFLTWNCSVVRTAQGLNVTLSEELVDNVHVNLRTSENISISGSAYMAACQFGWIRQ